MTNSFAIQELGAALTKLERRVVAGFDQLNRRISALESNTSGRFDDMQARAGKQIAELGTKVEAGDARHRQVGYQLDEMEARLGKRIEGLDAEFRKQAATLTAKVDATGGHFTSPS